MTSNSGQEGHCERCGCAKNNHTFGRCEGRSGKGSKSVACKFQWSRCTTGGHNDIAYVRYVDCARCLDHPGAPPSNGDFWGTQPDEETQEYDVPTADDLGIPWPEYEDKCYESKDKAASKGKDRENDGPRSKEAGHNRVDSVASGGSEDPLQWSPRKYEEETAGLLHDFSKATLTDEDRPVWSDWSWDGVRWARYYIDAKGEPVHDYQEHTGTWSKQEWDQQTKRYYRQTRDPDGVTFYLYIESSGESSNTVKTSTSGKKRKGKKNAGK